MESFQSALIIPNDDYSQNSTDGKHSFFMIRKIKVHLATAPDVPGIIANACGSVLRFRYVVIVHPMKSRSWCTMGNTKRIIIGVWILAIAFSSPLLYIMVSETLW